MPQQKTPVELTNFSKGLITEASVLTFPPDASIDEVNFLANKYGTRSRRLGMDYEEGYVLHDIEEYYDKSFDLDVGVFRWENAGNDADQTLAVVWYGNKLNFHDLSSAAVSSEFAFSGIELTKFSKYSPLSFASVDGNLVVAAGAEEFAIVSLSTGSPVVSYKRLLVRDLFGVGDKYSNTDTGGIEIDLRENNNIQFRPRHKTDQHIYNLRNQSWGLPRKPYRQDRQSHDPIEGFNSAISGTGSYSTIRNVDTAPFQLPSNSDVMHYSMMPDPSDEPPSDSLSLDTIIQNPVGSVEAPRGYFIIDALRRGTSRLSAYKDLMARNPRSYGGRNGLVVDIDTLPSDITPNGASLVQEYAGRVWYAGFSGEVIDGDEHSPKLSSYLLFSKLVSNTNDINKCYQDGDPTSEETPDIIDSDGGYLRISGAYGIKRLVNLGSSLAVLAQNGVWVILGQTEDAGFTATGYQVSKISEYSILSSKSAVEVDNGLIYWSEDGIYVLAKNELGVFSVTNLTQTTIQTFYEGITLEDKERAAGVFDPYERKVRWLYGLNKELIFDVNTGSFTRNVIGGDGVALKFPVRTTSYAYGVDTISIEVDGEVVTSDGEGVQVQFRSKQNGFRSVKYLTFTDIDDITFYTFSSYRNQGFIDWGERGAGGVDAAAYLLTGYMSGGDTQRNKQVPFLTIHLTQTEGGLDEDFELTNQSSCLVTTQWDWTNSVNSNRWGREFQAYKLRRGFMPSGFTFDNGHTVVSTKHKLRGKGKVLSMLFKTEPGKDCRILGWSMVVGTKVNV